MTRLRADAGEVPSARPRLVRWSVPLAVLALLLGFAGLRATLASAIPSLPELTAAQLLAKVAQSDVKSLSGVVRSSADLGLPALPQAEGELGPQAVLSGQHTLRLYLDGPDRQRVDLLGRLAETKLVHNGRDIWHWSSSTNKATHTRLPAQRSGKTPDRKPSFGKLPGATPQELAQRLLDMIGPTTQVSVGRAATVAGRSAYDLRLAPKTADSLIRRADLYVDSATGMPLRVTVLGRGSSKPVIDVGFTSIKLGIPPASVFRFSAPAGAKVTERSVPAPDKSRPDKSRPDKSRPDKSRPDKSRPDKSGPPEGARPPRGGSLLGGSGSHGTRVHGSGWATAIEIRGGPAVAASDPRLGALLKGARMVTGRFGSGRLVTTRLLTVLITDDGRIFAGPVTAPALLRMANAAGPR